MSKAQIPLFGLALNRGQLKVCLKCDYRVICLHKTGSIFSALKSRRGSYANFWLNHSRCTKTLTQLITKG